MKAYIIGAGVSKSAGYPLGRELLDSIRKEWVNSMISSRYGSWDKFEEWCEEQRDILPRWIIETRNPEFIITYIDLCMDSINYQKNKAWEGIGYNYKNGNEEKEKAIELKDELLRSIKAFEKVKSIHTYLLKAIEYFFISMNNRDSKVYYNNERRYIHKFCLKVEKDDVIITFNYDTLIERSLYERGIWSLKDGYGFLVELRPIESDLLNLKNQDAEPIHSEPPKVKVLKLHGSVGWLFDDRRQKKLYIDDIYLQSFNLGGLSDVNKPVLPGDRDRPIFIMPSFIKKLPCQELYDIWELASNSLKDANEIYIIGYSLPEPDVAAQTLIISNLRNQRSKKITVIDPNSEILDKYKSLLGNNIETEQRTFEKWIEGLYKN